PPYTKIELIQLPHQKPPQNITHKQIQQLKQKQPQPLLNNIKPQSTLITFQIKPKIFSSQPLPKHLQTPITQAQTDFTFLIPPSNPLHQHLLQRTNYALSFTTITFPHQIIRLILIQQIYPSFNI
ncbi:23S rRNA (pseudouridine(1915)-N(3))-methyltransferase RlmH, partial [Staphylococcus epidermidis]|uniref:23S rRNA (pseudouridine(1915)-N(3))-methyltransferase RlmH n=1 Tax=Staphylococcus epidermidis TaxID=1282 RepID=UPI00119DB4D5